MGKYKVREFIDLPSGTHGDYKEIVLDTGNGNPEYREPIRQMRLWEDNGMGVPRGEILWDNTNGLRNRKGYLIEGQIPD